MVQPQNAARSCHFGGEDDAVAATPLPDPAADDPLGGAIGFWARAGTAYISEVSRQVDAAIERRGLDACPSASVFCSPKVMVPSPIRLIFRPVRPSWRYSIPLLSHEDATGAFDTIWCMIQGEPEGIA